MKQAEIKGIIPAILTPMNEDESINLDVMREQIDRLIDGGVHGLFPFGTNGEGYILNEKEKEPNEIPFNCNQLGNLILLIDKGTISTSIGKKVLTELFENPRDPEDIIKEKGWIQISDEGAIKEVVSRILEANPQSIADYKAGKDRALGFLVGQAMKETKGKANPKMLNEMFLAELNK